MKMVFIFCICLVNFCFTKAQNVGIGTTTPTSKLEIHHRSETGIGLKLVDSSANLSGTLQFQNINFTRGMRASGFSANNFNSGQYLDIRSDSIIGVTFKGNGFAGIRNLEPGYPLDVAGTTNINGLLRVQNLNLLEFGAGLAGKEVNAGKIGYNAFGQNALTIVGGGTNTANRAVYFFAEGGTTMNGPLNVGGALSVNGSTGNTGQVLTSNGLGSPVWSNSALSNNTRFSVNFNIPGFSTTAGNVTYLTPVRYNNDPASISIGTTGITLTKAGLYHFELFVDTQIGYTSQPPIVPSFTAELDVGHPQRYTLISKPFPRTSISTVLSPEETFYFKELVSYEVYVNAGTVLRVYTLIGNPSLGIFAGAFTGGYLTAHLISE